jgi:hypothetical protein
MAYNSADEDDITIPGRQGNVNNLLQIIPKSL